ncbi:hypothetical protein SETIT_3G285700v2 [Setaria italica]|uniref:CCT domain-containing protein n=1 Tax=Setaria italica TaxID=4555 RepID=A0A368QKJ8_SETIT|nr:hypothetical protein SETIT_3G285700v2 [Setaria italica]
MLPDDCITEEISSPIAAHILDFYDGGLGMTSLLRRLPPPVHSLPLMMIYGDDAPAAGATAYSPLPSFDTTLTALLEEEQHRGLDTELLPQIDGLSEVAYYPTATDEAGIGQFNQMGLPETLAEQVPPMQMSSSASVLMPPTSDYDECYTAAWQTGAILPGCNAEASQQGFFNSASSNSTVMIGEYQKMMEDSMQGTFNTNAEMQVGGNNQHLINGCNGNPTTLPPTELSGLEDSTFKVVRLSPEERKEKIHRYIKKRNERNFSKKIKYACRKTLADSRARDHMKEEDMMDTSDILAQLSGLNSYNYKYKCTIESWI